MSKKRTERNSPIIDFSELSQSGRSGLNLEGLARLLGQTIGLEVEWSGEGPDQGKDLIFTDLEQGKIGRRSFRWLVQCKDNSIGTTSVAESDVLNLTERLKLHGCNGFLLICTTRVTAGLKRLLDGLETPSQIWEEHELRQFLLKPENEHLLFQYFPESYKRIQQLQIKAEEKRTDNANFGLKYSMAKTHESWTAVTTRDYSIHGMNTELTFPQFQPSLSTDIEEINLVIRATIAQTIQDLRLEAIRADRTPRSL